MWLDCNMGKKPRIVSLYIFLNVYKIEVHVTQQDSEMEMCIAIKSFC